MKNSHDDVANKVAFLSGYSSDINSFLKAILRRCTLETNPDVRLLLAECLGKVGAISPMYIDNDQDLETDLLSDDGKRWLVENGKPWKTKMDRVHYEKQLVTHHFVIALKAARTPTDQHKIAFAIQEGKIGCLLFAITFNTNLTFFTQLIFCSSTEFELEWIATQCREW